MTGPRTHTFSALVTALLLAAGTGSAAGELAQAGTQNNQSGYPGPHLTSVAGRAVFASMLNRQVRSEVCPRQPLPLNESATRRAATVIVRALPPLLAHARKPGAPKVDAAGAKASAAPASRAHSGEDFRRFCGTEVWTRSLFVVAHLPNVKTSASLSVLSFLIADTPRGWIIWGEVH